MDPLILGSLVLSLLHALIPSHWIPFITIAHAERWSRGRTLWVTALAGLAHTISTTLLGLLVSLAGWQLSDSDYVLSERVIPLLLLALGLWYLMQHLRHHHSHSHLDEEVIRQRSFRRILVALLLAMFLSPCLEIEAYFLSAGARGTGAIVTVALIYNVITLGGMLGMVALGRQGLRRLNTYWLEHHENLITGLTLISLAVLNWVVEF